MVSPYDFEENDDIIFDYFKMNKDNSIETLNKYLDLANQTKFRLNETNEFKDFFNSEIWERKAMNKKLSKYIAGFDYIEKTWIVLSAASRWISIISFTSIIGIPIGITSARLNTLFRFKDPLEKKIRSGIIYRYTCSNCKITYYGKTFHHFYTRAAKHMGISNLTRKSLKNFKQSAVSDHHHQLIAV